LLFIRPPCFIWHAARTCAGPHASLLYEYDDFFFGRVLILRSRLARRNVDVSCSVQAIENTFYQLILA